MSDALKLLQQKWGCKPDGSFGPNTARAIVQHYDLSPEEGGKLLGQGGNERGDRKDGKEKLTYSV